MRHTWVAIAWCLATAVATGMLSSTDPIVAVHGRIVDAQSRKPVPEAVITVGTVATRTDATGRFTIAAGPATVLHARAQGYLRADVNISSLARSAGDIGLRPFTPKALYLTVYGIGSTALRGAALELIGTTDLNALVIDLKGDRGLIPYRSGATLASSGGSQKVITIPDLPALVTGLRQAGIYTIARIVAFKDEPLASARSELAIRRKDGSLYRDREHLAWTNPYSREVRNYNIAVAVEAARAGFDEIQFDYARLPDSTGLAYDKPWTEANRVSAIDTFLTDARAALLPYNVFLAADIFGYVCWNTDDTKIGQQLEHIAAIVDYVSPMLYPSGFQFGIPGYRNPVQHPYEIVRLSLEQARARTQLSPLHFRPWLQAFRDYAFGRPFSMDDVRAQIRAADQFGSDGWMLWNPRNRYAAPDAP